MFVWKSFKRITCEKNKANIVEKSPVKTESLKDFDIPGRSNEELK